MRAEAFARLWLGTPFVEGAALRGVGADCAGLIEGVALDAGLHMSQRRDGALGLLKAARASFDEIAGPRAGCIVLLSVASQALRSQEPTHAGIYTAKNTIIHAHWSQGVVENNFGSWFRARLTHCFFWPHKAETCETID